MEDPIDAIIQSFPASFFVTLQEYTDDAFMKAHRIGEERFSAPERQATVSQMRHALMEEAFREAGKATGVKTVTCDTQPSGGRYTFMENDGIFILRSNILSHCGGPRPTKFRSQFSAFNAWLSPQQLDFLIEVPEPKADKLCAMLITTAHRKGSPEIMPAFVGIGIPYPDLSGWRQLISLSSLLSRYHDLDTEESALKAPVVEIKDIAIPTLKRRARDNKE